MLSGVSAIRDAFSLSVLLNLMVLLNLSTQIWLARYLSPEIFGAVSLAFALLSVLELFLDWGTAPALLEYDHDPAFIHTIFALRVGFSLLVTIMVCIGFYLLRGIYDRQLLIIMVILSLGTVSVSMYDVFKAVMQKEMMLRAIGGVDLLSVVLASAIGISAASMGFGIWSLVAYHLSGPIGRGIGYIVMSPYRPQFRLDRTNVQRLWQTTRNILWVGLAERMDSRAGEWFLGTLYGAQPLGFYAFAQRISFLGQQLLLPVIHLTTLPTFARFKNTPEQLTQGYQFMVRTFLRILLPLCMMLYLFPEEVVVVVGGPQWAAAAPILKILTVYAIAAPLFHIHQQLFYALGLSRRYMYLKIIQVGVYVAILIPFSYFWGAIGLAWAVNTGYFVGNVAILMATRKIVSVPWRSLLILASASLVAIVGAGLTQTISISWPTPLRWGITGFMLLSIYTGWIVVFERALLKQDVNRVFHALKNWKAGDSNSTLPAG